MNRRQRLADLSMKIFGRAVELFDSDKMSFAEAQKLAAQQLATKERLKPRGAAAKSKVEVKPLISDGDHPNAREELFARIFGIKERQSKPTKTIGGRIKRFIFTEDHQDQHVSNKPAAIPAEATPVETAPPILEVYTGRSTPELIPDDEYPVGMCDRTTQNWRKSLTESLPRKPENEIDPLNQAEVEAQLKIQQANVIAFPTFPKVSTK